MPRLSRWMLRAALIYLLLGFTIGALLLAHKGIGLHPLLWGWLPAHIDFLLFGWIVQATLATAFWILPRYWQPPKRPRSGLAWAAAVLLNLGIWLVFAGATLRLGWAPVLAGRVAQLLALLLFGVHAWGRVVGRDG